MFIQPIDLATTSVRSVRYDQNVVCQFEIRSQMFLAKVHMNVKIALTKVQPHFDIQGKTWPFLLYLSFCSEVKTYLNLVLFALFCFTK